MNDGVLISEKDELVMKIIHYFVTEEDYKPVIVHGIDNEIWLENFDANYKLIRINTNYIHNNTQFETDLYRTDSIRKSIKKRTYSFKMNVLNILVDYGDSLNIKEEYEDDDIFSIKVNDIESTYIKDEYPGLIKELKSNKKDMLEFFKMTEDMNKKNAEEEKIYKRWMNGPSKYSVTNILIAINIIVFVLMYILGNGSEDNQTLINFGALYGPYVKAGEVYRLISCAFIHIGIMHLLFNMIALYQVGNEIEKYYGKVKLIIIYLASALLGSLSSTLFNPGYISAGASGAIFGLFGSLLYFGMQYRATLDGIIKSPIMGVIVANLAIGFIIPGIDVTAHIGGLIAGFMMSKFLGVDGKNGKKVESINSLIFLIILMLFMCYMIFIYK